MKFAPALKRGGNLKFAPALKKGVSAFFFSVGLLAILHFIFGWPEEYNHIWLPAFAVGISFALGQCWRSWKVREER